MNSLAAEHRADVARSGLTEEILAALQIESVRPQDLTVPGAQSAYRIPYFTIDGTRNCFERWRLFPVLKRPDGSKQKYYQPAGTDPSLYLPPLCSWKTVASQPAAPLLIVEGEKKAAAGCAKGLFAIGVGGLWNWRQKLDNRDPLVIPTIDQFLWTGREVCLVPDSDAWRAGRELDLLAGFYALGQELISRGASVRLLRLPDRNGLKQGLDDWLVAVGAEWESLWPHLERFGLDDERLKTVAAWWQNWRAKNAQQEAVRNRVADECHIEETGGLIHVTFPTHNVQFFFDRVQDARGGVQAELAVKYGVADLLSGTDISCKSDTSRSKIARTLKELASEIPWGILLSKACSKVVELHRQGEPPVILTMHTEVEPLDFMVHPTVPCGKTTIQFGDSGIGKSSNALLQAMLCSVGGSLAGFAAKKGRPLYLDYEDSQDVHARRLKAIIAAHPELAGAEVPYQFCTEPLFGMAPQLMRRIAHDRIDFLVIDSLAIACGGDPMGAESALRIFRVLRQLKCSVLLLAHQPKNVGEGDPTIYGSTFKVGERKEQEVEHDQIRLGLFHRKSNLDRLHSPMGFLVTCASDGSRMHFAAADVSESVDLSKGLSLTTRLKKALRGGAMTAKELSEELGTDVKPIRSRLAEGSGKWCVPTGKDDQREKLWGLLAL